jgi:hypothetical protein
MGAVYRRAHRPAIILSAADKKNVWLDGAKFAI